MDNSYYIFISMGTPVSLHVLLIKTLKTYNSVTTSKLQFFTLKNILLGIRNREFNIMLSFEKVKNNKKYFF